MCFTIFLCAFMSDILIHTPPYFLIWSISGHPVSARLAGLSNPRIPLLPFLLSWDYKYSPQCLLFLRVLGIWTHVLIIAKQTMHILNISQAPMWQPIIPWRLFCLYWKMISLYFWMLIIFFSFFIVLPKKITYIPSTFCFHFFLPFLLPLIIIIIIL